jgi:hypothetical protein
MNIRCVMPICLIVVAGLNSYTFAMTRFSKDLTLRSQKIENVIVAKMAYRNIPAFWNEVKKAPKMMSLAGRLWCTYAIDRFGLEKRLPARVINILCPRSLRKEIEDVIEDENYSFWKSKSTRKQHKKD